MNKKIAKSGISDAEIVDELKEPKTPENERTVWDKILYLFYCVALSACCLSFYFLAKENLPNASDTNYHYSHEIHVSLNTKKSTLEDWHQALVDSIYASTYWSSRNFHPQVSVTIDSVYVSYPVQLDSLTLCLANIDRLYKEYYTDALNDLRQESNNNINKWSAWLGFWISVFAVLMGVLPLVLQFHLSNRSGKRVKSEIVRLEKQYQDKEKELDNHYRQKEQTLDTKYQKLQEKLNEQSKTVDENLRNQEIGRLKSKVVNIINAIDLSKNNKLLKDSTERKLLLRTLLVDLNKQFFEFIKEYKKIKDCKGDDKYKDLLVVLIEIHGVVTKLIPILQSRMISRRINIFQHNLQELILKLANECSSVDFSEIKNIQDRFDELINEF